ncbi:aromatic aminobenezylarsenical efflux permease ArsG family transporter [Shewanella sp. SM32]|uniref:aromatic aminobenezylarsenical efflux permease ArsG family transporter n=1 Tax=Shewanella sp. SM32 TaxID=2912796 RepID=UPI0021D81911|nr:aromatic aminobenezylarsenical efflux permease ArsG family transporter [Shewanella sp. SM32]MCU8072386.1 aromatic aminobenezylarsenical efflux permease ArsG family transporter [Shewanella sp. SM32]
MDEWAVMLLSAFWFGILTSISPCPLATNVAAISYISKGIQSPYRVFATGLAYTIGRMLSYLVLGVVLVGSLLSTVTVSVLLQKYMNLLLGPILILVGMFLLELLTLRLPGSGVLFEKLKAKINPQGYVGALLLGILFALSFCPTSAALFFGSLLPLALESQSSIALPAIYGVATGLPVLVFAILLGISANRVAKAYNHILAFEHWARKITGVVFIIIGGYYAWVNIFSPFIGEN